MDKKTIRPPKFPVDAAWYSLEQIKNLSANPTEILQVKQKEQLTCDLTFKDVLDNKKDIEVSDLRDIAAALGYRYFIAISGEVMEVTDIKIGDAALWRRTGLWKEDINEIL